MPAPDDGNKAVRSTRQLRPSTIHPPPMTMVLLDKGY
jgi:hypothetical protein